MKMIPPIRYLLLACLVGLACLRGAGQEEILTLEGGLAKVSVRYILLADKPYNGIQIDNLPNKTINPAIHKNPSIRIEVELLEITTGYEVYIPTASYKDNLDGFRRLSTSRNILKSKGEKSRINYVYKPDVSGDNPIPLTLFIRKAGGNIIGSTNSSGQSYTLIRGGGAGSPTPVQPKAPSASGSETDFVELFEQLEATSDLSQQLVICQTFATAFNALPTQPSSEIVNQITIKCREISMKKEWADTEGRINKMTKNYEQINAVNTFLRKYPNHEPAKQKLAEIDKRKAQLEQGQGEATTKPMAAPQSVQAQSIRENFRIEEIDRVEQGDVVIVTLEAKNHANRVVKLVPSVNIGIEKRGGSTFDLAIPKGTVVEVTPIVEGLGELETIIIDLDFLPLIAKYIWDTDKKKLNIDIRDGIPPYRLHILNADGAVVETEKVEGNTHTLVLADYKRLPKGEYDLQIIDEQGAYRSQAGHKGIELGSMYGPVLMYLWLALVLLVIGGIVYLYYKRSQVNAKLSETKRAYFDGLDTINIIVRLVSSNEDIEVSLPLDIQIRDVVEMLLHENLAPKFDAAGMPITYRLSPKSYREVTFDEDDLLSTYLVKSGDIILMTPVFGAGGPGVIFKPTLKGKLLYSIPKKILIGTKSRVEVRISKGELKDYLLKEGLVSDDDVKEIEIEKVMKVILTENAVKPGLEIRRITDEEQLITNDGYTVWLFDIISTKIGVSSLILNISLVENIKKMGNKVKTVFLFEQEINTVVISERNSSEFASFHELEEVTSWNDTHKNQLVDFIVKNETGKALSMIINHFQKNREIQSSMILLKSQFNQGKNFFTLNLIDPMQWLMLQSRINYAVLEIAKEIRCIDLGEFKEFNGIESMIREILQPHDRNFIP